MNTHQIGVKAIIEREDTVLLIKRSMQYQPTRYRDLAETWDLPGGRLEPLEGLEEGLRREVREETGLHIQQIQDTLEIKTVFQSKTEHIVRITYVCSVVDYTLRLSAEHTSANWVRREQLPQLQYKDDLLKETLLKYCLWRK